MTPILPNVSYVIACFQHSPNIESYVTSHPVLFAQVLPLIIPWGYSCYFLHLWGRATSKGSMIIFYVNELSFLCHFISRLTDWIRRCCSYCQPCHLFLFCSFCGLADRAGSTTIMLWQSSEAFKK